MKYLYIVLAGQLLLVAGLIVLLGLAPYPLPSGLIHWDAHWYESIRARGYFFRPDAKSSVAFFPLFPLLWRVTHLPSIGICLLNLGLAAGAAYWLKRALHLRPVALLLFAAFPSTIFLYLPYTEALFFVFTTLVLVLLARWPQQVGLLALALFGTALTRVSAFFFLPALVVVEGLGWLREPATWLARLGRLLVYGLSVGAGLMAVLSYQWYQTGVWFAFNKAEEQWHHHLQVPRLPFISTTDNDGALWLDGLALLVGVLALGWLAYTVGRALRQRAQAPAPDWLLVLALTYMAEVTVQVVMQAPIEAGYSSLMSLNRYVFCSPFFLVLLDRVLPRRPLGLRPMLGGLAVVLVLTAFLGMLGTREFVINWPVRYLLERWGAIAGTTYAAAILLYVALWLRSGTAAGRALVYAGSLALQLFYFYSYSVGHWVG